MISKLEDGTNLVAAKVEKKLVIPGEKCFLFSLKLSNGRGILVI